MQTQNFVDESIKKLAAYFALDHGLSSITSIMLYWACVSAIPCASARAHNNVHAGNGRQRVVIESTLAGI